MKSRTYLSVLAAISILSLTALSQPVATSSPPKSAAKQTAQAPKDQAKATKADAAVNPALAMQNRAVRLSMLAERMTKCYAQLRYGVATDRARRQLDAAVANFDRDLVVLRKDAPTPEIRENYALLSQIWVDFRARSQEPAGQENLQLMAEQNEEVVWIATKGSQLIEKHFASPRAGLLVNAGEVGIVIQRIAKLQLFRAAGVRGKVIHDDIKAAEIDYRALIEKLQKAAPANETLQSEIAIEEAQWVFLKSALQKANKGNASKQDLETIAKTADNILEVMDRLTAKFEAQT